MFSIGKQTVWVTCSTLAGVNAVGERSGQDTELCQFSPEISSPKRRKFTQESVQTQRQIAENMAENCREIHTHPQTIEAWIRGSLYEGSSPTNGATPATPAGETENNTGSEPTTGENVAKRARFVGPFSTSSKVTVTPAMLPAGMFQTAIPNGGAPPISCGRSTRVRWVEPGFLLKTPDKPSGLL